MSGVMGAGMDGRGGGARSGAPDGRPEGGREVRWSARRKEEVVLRLLSVWSLAVASPWTGGGATASRRSRRARRDRAGAAAAGGPSARP